MGCMACARNHSVPGLEKKPPEHQPCNASHIYISGRIGFIFHLSGFQDFLTWFIGRPFSYRRIPVLDWMVHHQHLFHLYAVTGKTAAEIIVSRANADKPNMAPTSWKGSIVRKQDIFIAKNYLSEDEIDTLNRLVVIFLESAELRAKNRLDIPMSFWKENVDRILESNDRKVLKDAGSISNAQMEKKVKEIYGQYDAKRKAFYALTADNLDMEELEKSIKSTKGKK